MIAVCSTLIIICNVLLVTSSNITKKAKKYRTEHTTTMYSPDPALNFGEPVYTPDHPPVTIPQHVGFNHTSTVIFLHGIGDSGHFWAEELTEVRPQQMKIICPHGVNMALTINHGIAVPAWYNKKKLRTQVPEDTPGLNAATKYIHHVIKEELLSGVAPERIVMGGYAQGGALALQAALTYPVKLGGIFTLCTHESIKKMIKNSVVPENTDIPIMQWHGEADPIKMHNATKIRWRDFQTKEFTPYLENTIKLTEEERNDLRNFFKKHFPNI